MEAIKNFDEVQAGGEFEKLPAGGYVIKITDVQDVPDKSYLRIVFDIAEGSEKGKYANELPENDFRHSFPRSYKEKALPMFKAFMVAVDESNGTNYTSQIQKGFAERQLIGRVLGAIIGYEEYEANDGTVKEKMRIVATVSADRIRRGDFKVPELRKLNNVLSGFTPISDDTPF